MTVLCLVEQDGGVVDASSRALTLAGGLAVGSAAADGPLAAVAFGTSGEVDASALSSYGVSSLYVVEPDSVPGYAPQAWAATLAGLLRAVRADVVVAAATDRGNEVMAHLGAVTGLPMAANCVQAERAGNGVWRLARQRWGGLLLEDAELEAEVALMTVTADATAPGPAAEPVALQVRAYRPELAEADLLVRASGSAERAAGASLATARVVVGGGRGVGGPEGFAPLEELAELLGGVVGVSRVVTSEGWRPHAQQVGQTGARITPEVYLACGISGAIQHMAGCSGAKNIIAVNKDPGAPMVSHADYAVIGDLHEVVPALVAAIRERISR